MGIFYKNSKYVTENISVAFWHVKLKDIGLEMHIYYLFILN